MRLFEIRRVRGVSFGPDAQRRDLGFGGLAVLVDRKVRERHVGALLGEFQGDGFADAAGRARYDSDFSFE